MSRHTPGPWRVGIGSFKAPSIYCEDPSGGHRFIASVVSCWFKYTTENGNERNDGLDGEVISNANLIAAAPDLLKALKDLLSVEIDHDDDFVKAGLLAIKKAEATSAYVTTDEACGGLSE